MSSSILLSIFTEFVWSIISIFVLLSLSCIINSSLFAVASLISCSNTILTLLIPSVIAALFITFFYSLATVTISLSTSNISVIILSIWSFSSITTLLFSAIISLLYSLVTILTSLITFSLFYIFFYYVNCLSKLLV